jgi:glycosyltransferase involved in cell wall biosynthesis
MQTPVQHVAHVTECLAGGTLAVVRHLADELAGLHVRQTLIYSRRPDSPADVPSLFPATMRLIEVRPARATHLEFISDLTRALHWLMTNDAPDLVHLHSSKAGFVGRLALRAIDARAGTRSRILYSPHGLAFLNPLRPWSNAAYWLLERLAGLVDCQSVGCGASEARALASVNRRPARVLENPVDPAFFDVRQNDPERPVVITVGRVCEQKAPELFAELSVRVRLDAEDARFVWVGAGDADAEAMLRAVGVEVTGWRNLLCADIALGRLAAVGVAGHGCRTALPGA